jgi:hypothetical protein
MEQVAGAEEAIAMDGGVEQWNFSKSGVFNSHVRLRTGASSPALGIVAAGPSSRRGRRQDGGRCRKGEGVARGWPLPKT